MTGVFLWVIGLAATWVTFQPNFQWVQPVMDAITEQQQLLQDEQERNYLAEQEEIIVEDYFLFLDKIGKIKYARWCMGEYTPPVRSEEKQKRVRYSDNAFDCAGLIKWYGIAKGIITTKEASHMNSQTIVLLWEKKDATLAKRWDFTSWQGYWERSTGNLSTHFAMVSRDYTGGNILRIYDNVNWPNNNIVWERAIKVAYNRGKFNYMGKYRISVYSNGLVETARERNITVDRWIDTEKEDEKFMSEIDQNNPLWFSVIISWFAYDSDINRQASFWANNWWSDYMIAKFIAEAHGNVNAIGKDWERWTCQLIPNSTNNVWINDPRWNEWREFQAQVCLEKWNAVPDPDAIWYANAYTELKNIIHLDK